ncbi:MAG: polyprenyl synthetase family protein [Candidatus Omnitrophica bacterium]|nr:polyprenyl synthetase family protein [Candidatus Omnitrophota bacterium]
MDIKKYISKKKKVIDKALDKFLPSSKTRPQALHKAMRYAVFPGGKRIRPILTLASFEACGGNSNKILPVACGIELIHTYTLIHDDLPCMDNDDYRRGRLSCHKKSGEDIALLAGDALLTLAFQLFSEHGNREIIKEVSRAIGSQGTIGGQVADIEAKSEKRKATLRQAQGRPEQGRGTKNENLNYIANHKTGALFEVAVKSGGIFKGVGKKKINSLGNFGRLFGFTFQLIDDLMDGDGYAKAYGRERTRNMAGDSNDKAKKGLKVFGNRAARLVEIADLVLKRRS